MTNTPPKDKKEVKHITKDNSPHHILSWDEQGKHCSEPNCEVNFTPKPTKELIKKIKEIENQICRHLPQTGIKGGWAILVKDVRAKFKEIILKEEI